MTNATVASRSGYVPGIDGLRALAVLSVFLFHLKADLLPGGFSGVDVFFVISGYVVSSSLAKEAQNHFSRFALAFYARRIVRIYPALVLCLCISGLMQTLLVPSSWLSTTSNKTGILAFFGLSNFALTWFDDGYFAPRTEFNVFTHTWSLAVEEQFYVIFPAILFVWLKWRSRKDWRGVAGRALLPFLLMASLLLSWYQTARAPDLAFYWMPGRFWELACGAMLFTLHAQNRFLVKSWRWKSGAILVGLAMIAVGFWFCDPKQFPFPWALLPVVGTLLVIEGVIRDAGCRPSVGGLLDNAIIVYVGKLSYSLYLWHWPVIVIFRWTTGLDRPLEMLSATAIAAALSVFSYHAVERPARQHGRLLSRSDWHIVSRGTIAISICAFAVLGTFKAQSYLSLSVTKDKRNWYPENWHSEIKTKDKPGVSDFKGRKIFVLGDSHAGAYNTMFQMLEDELGVVVRQYAKGGCSVAGLLKAPTPDCAHHNQQAFAKVIAEAAPGDIVFLASLRVSRLGGQHAIFDAADFKRQQMVADESSRQYALLEADSIVASFEKAGLPVIIDAPKPLFRSPPFRCSDWFNESNPVCAGGMTISRDFLVEHRRPTMEALVNLVDKHPGLVVWDPFPVLCANTTCSAYDHGLPLFFDGDHLSGHGNRVLYPSFVAVLEAIWLPKRERASARTEPKS